MPNDPIITIGADKIRPLIFTPENLKTFWEKAKNFPLIYGKEINTELDFIDIFFERTPEGLAARGLFWVLNDFTGVFHLNNITEDRATGEVIDAHIHYTFFDRRHHGRVDLCREILKFWFKKYKFNRLTAEIPNYTTSQARHFAQACGLSYEGKRRKSALYKGIWYDTNLYGILRSEVLNGNGSEGNTDNERSDTSS